jgi:uncharacterized protein YukJ
MSRYAYSLAIGNVVEAFSPPEVADIVDIDDSKPGDGSRARAGRQHFNLSLDVAQGKTIQCNINVRSNRNDPNIRYLRIDNFKSNAVLNLLQGSTKSFQPISQGLSYGDLFNVNQMQLLDENAERDSSGEVSLVKVVADVIKPAMEGGPGTVYVFGRGYWDDNVGTIGIDEVHMNDQVGDGSNTQDGALIVANGDGTYTGLFIAFDSQFSQDGSER